MTGDGFLATVYVAKEFCHYVASVSPNMLRWQVIGRVSQQNCGERYLPGCSSRNFHNKDKINWCFI